MGITIVGSLNYDLVTFTSRIPDSGETFRASNFETHAGGKGLNQTVAISRLRKPNADYPVRMIGNVGDDSFGRELLDVLSQNKVDTSHVGALAGVNTGVANIIVEQEKGGQNRILIVEGANGGTVYTSDELKSLFDSMYSQKEMVVLQHEIPDPVSIMKWVNENKPGYQIVYNPSPFQPLKRDSWALVDILVVNEIEALQVAQCTYDGNHLRSIKDSVNKDFIEGYKQLCKLFQADLVNENKSATVIITLGVKRRLFSSKAQPDVGYLPAVTGIKVVDTTGAGDTFLGAVVTQLYEGEQLATGISFATTASSLAIQKSGAAESIPSHAEVNAATGDS
ncbi:hypothetical protein KAFR_0G00220 [Kazachstania africana CBS 2517]|uniref:Ribokinase n=1 Tax=Kazachstania africana (strain ATCC 22294 / BCRC 22015 / CBS 2517 / CECT 1963 / NBRC 1671 / NRRL Y-8276) TaxID=1071382 RepID=H2AXF5_KAZAF|nr:hypothetical protein KAFR_0G00220 [Kazachstania africana CBS 2517]CCF59055.1 hypothetical protein KAFR_0G00220 [Kazachstania africana CBS 2517]